VIYIGHRSHAVPKIDRTNFGGILYHSPRVKKQKTLKILCFVICVEDYQKLATDTNIVFNPVPLVIQSLWKRFWEQVMPGYHFPGETRRERRDEPVKTNYGTPEKCLSYQKMKGGGSGLNTKKTKTR
jgi:hypothetical protein